VVFPFSAQLAALLARDWRHRSRNRRRDPHRAERDAVGVAEGSIDGYCVGEGSLRGARLRPHHRQSYEIWNNAPEKVLGVTHEWAQHHPRAPRPRCGH
jgi:ABC-type nitrate/sulfonate/bicarbonate transport system substrate-binding protein